MAILTITIMTRGCESKQAHSRCQSHQQDRIIFGNDFTIQLSIKINKKLFVNNFLFSKLTPNLSRFPH
jgi:hypothetical protein